jgi:hypothetical protein
MEWAKGGGRYSHSSWESRMNTRMLACTPRILYECGSSSPTASECRVASRSSTSVYGAVEYELVVAEGGGHQVRLVWTIANVDCSFSLIRTTTHKSKIGCFVYHPTNSRRSLACHAHVETKVVEMTRSNLPIAMLLAVRPPKCLSFFVYRAHTKAMSTSLAQSSLSQPGRSYHSFKFVPMHSWVYARVNENPPAASLTTWFGNFICRVSHVSDDFGLCSPCSSKTALEIHDLAVQILDYFFFSDLRTH